MILNKIKIKTIENKFKVKNKHNFVKLHIDSTYKFDINKIKIGNKSYGQINVRMYGNDSEQLIIGSYCSIAPNTLFLLGGNHTLTNLLQYPIKNKLFNSNCIEATTKGPIVVEDDVWIGINSTILSGVTIGKGAIIGACSVVTKDVPPYSIVAGNPAKVIKYRFSPEIIEKLCKINYSNIKVDNNNLDLFYTTIDETNIDNIIKKLGD